MQTLHDCEEVLSHNNEEDRKDSIPPAVISCISKFNEEVLLSMLDDLHTPVSISALSEPLKTINDLLHTRKGKKQELRIESLAALEKAIKKVLSILGLMPTSYSEVLQQLMEKALKRAKLTEDQVLQKIEERTSARMSKEYEKSDSIRKELAAVGIALMDGPDGTSWRPAVPLSMQEQQISAA